MSTKSTRLKIGKKDIDLVYSPTAIIELDERGINLYSPRTFDDFSPSKLLTLVWAGQLDAENPMTRDQIAAIMPTDHNLRFAVAAKVAQAIRVSLNIKKPEEAAPAEEDKKS